MSEKIEIKVDTSEEDYIVQKNINYNFFGYKLKVSMHQDVDNMGKIMFSIEHEECSGKGRGFFLVFEKWGKDLSFSIDHIAGLEYTELCDYEKWIKLYKCEETLKRIGEFLH